MITEANQPAQTGASEEESESHRILVVDDDARMRALARAILENLGHSPDEAASGEEAVRKYGEASQSGTPYAAVVMDLALPGGISGLEATIAIKQIDPNSKVIVSSGYLEQQARGAAIEHGFAGMLPKPYSADRLASELRWVLKRES